MGTGDRTDPGSRPAARADGSGHRVPEGQAPEEYGDHRGRGEGDDHEHRSRWPLVAAAGAAGLYGGVAIAILGNETGLVPPLIGVALAVLGVVVLLTGLGGWIEQAFLVPARDRDAAASPESRESYVSTTLLFLATDVSTFGALFVYYAFVRVGAWPPEELPPLVGSLVAVNTAILLASSVTFHYAHAALEDGNRRRFLGFLGTTLALGVAFLVGQAYEYYEFVAAEGFSLGSGVFGTAFYGLTGLHGFHVALGVGGIGVLCWRALRGDYGPDRETSVATVSLYWHFVDLVWLVLVAVLYVGASV